MPHFKDYKWKRGLPFGVNPCPENSLSGKTFKVVSDPYYKRNSVEEYQDGNFVRCIYDSAIFDFRQLRQGEQPVWQKTLIKETSDTAVCHIRNQDDRLVLIEEYAFVKDVCRECRASSPQGVLISVQKILLKSFDDPVNGVTLFDANHKPVMSKTYAIDESTQEFTDLLEEKWEL